MRYTVKKYQDYLKEVRLMAWSLIVLFCMGLFSPAVSIAGGGGPTQPEVQGFTPIGVSSMVDPFTGDFSYNIPLMDVEGYPINIAYGSGITMDQEASWVGLGWNLNMGSVVRSMRGLPDDFNGDEIVKVHSQKPEESLTLNLSAQLELFGKTKVSGTESSLNMNVGGHFTFSNYTGLEGGLNFGPAFETKKKSGLALNTGVTFTGSTENGSGFSPSIGLSKNYEKGSKVFNQVGGTIGSSYNSRAGLQDISYQGNIVRSTEGKISKVVSEIGGKFGSAYSFGVHQYSPTVGPSFVNSSISGNVSLGASVIGLDFPVTLGLVYNVQKINPDYLTQTNPAYGFFNLHDGQTISNALLDFNRDNDGSFTKYTPNLPSSCLTSDLFSIQAQGIGGSYKAYRNEVGYVFDPQTQTTSNSGSLGLEFGTGNFIDFGVDLTYNHASSVSGAWDDYTNAPRTVLKFEPAAGILEEFAFQEANEKAVDNDVLFTNQFFSEYAENLDLQGGNYSPILANELSQGGTSKLLSSNSRTNRIKRNEVLSFLTIAQVKEGLGINAYNTNVYAGAKDHHIGEITQLGTDGRRYIFGIPAYNHTQEDATFSVGAPRGEGPPSFLPTNDYAGIVQLGNKFDNAASIHNSYGLDNMFSSETTPAYAHAFLLTAVVSDDYIDSDGEKGPSENDFGTFVKFDYTKVNDFKWRTPIEENSGFYNEGLLTDPQDDKASFVYGEKDIWYVEAVETKNYVAVFTLEDRQDGVSAKGRKGGLDPSAGKMKCLKKISLYVKPANYDDVSDVAGLTPVQEVNFVYDYSLCPGYKGHPSGRGKLTLKEIFFTYQGSFKMKRSSYKFEYGNNVAYNMKAVDRWGNYKPSGSGSDDYTSSAPLTNAEYPYAEQNKTQADLNAMAWHLTSILLPSGGKIAVNYESDDYAYVQHLKASRMFPIVAVGDQNGDLPASISETIGSEASIAVDGNNENRAIFFKLNNPSDDVSKYASADQPLYFRCLTKLNPNGENKYEFVSGYGTIKSIDKVGAYGRITFKEVKLNDNGDEKYSPITKAAILFGRMNMSRYIYDTGIGDPASTDGNGLINYANTVINSITSLSEMVTGPNKRVYSLNKGKEIVVNKSFIRLLEPTGRKLGGGVRVSSIRMYDNWDYMVRNSDPNKDYEYSYGQKFEYVLEDGTSSGVATYEPMVGGDENSWHTPHFYDNKYRLAPDDKLYTENPIMESQFPSPSVGYSRVVITDLKPDASENINLSRTATGKVVKEFYTAKDFPTIVRNTDVDMKTANSFLPLVPQYNYLTASQGFSIVLNDMHGKPKSEAVYGENQTSPISTVNYDYLKKPITYLGVPCFELQNSVTTISSDGSSHTSELGVKYEATADFRQNISKTVGGSIDVNFNSFALFPLVVAVPTVWPKLDLSESKFKSATLTKVINKFGIQNKTTADQDGSKVETNNLAYDGETGEVLVTQTTTNFNDNVYSMNYPVHWKYEQMGPAYRNIGYSVSGYPAGADGFVPVSLAQNYFVEGDEVRVTANGWTTPKKAWVVEVSTSGIRLKQEDGSPITGTNTGITIIRSGRRNKQSTSMASITTLDNPITGLTSGVFTKVINAGAVEFQQDWLTFCNCFTPEEGRSSWSPAQANPYVRGTKGSWRPVKSYTYLTNRTQSTANNSTNIRKDGVFESYTPYYKYSNGTWGTFGANWTFVTEVTKFSPNGATLETRDALGRYSASLFGFRNTLTTAVATNSSYRKIIEASFEDFGHSNCMDQSIFASAPSSSIVTTQAHSGRTSIHVLGNNSINFGSIDDPCTPTPRCNLSLYATSNEYYEIIGGVSTNYTLITSGVIGSGGASVNSGVLSLNHNDTNYFEITLFVTNTETKCTMKVKFYTTGTNNSQFTYQILSVN